MINEAAVDSSGPPIDPLAAFRAGFHGPQIQGTCTPLVLALAAAVVTQRRDEETGGFPARLKHLGRKKNGVCENIFHCSDYS